MRAAVHGGALALVFAVACRSEPESGAAAPATPGTTSTEALGWVGWLLGDADGAKAVVSEHPQAWKALLHGDYAVADAGFTKLHSATASVGRARALEGWAGLHEQLALLVAEAQGKYLSFREASVGLDPALVSFRDLSQDIMEAPENLRGCRRALASWARGRAAPVDACRLEAMGGAELEAPAAVVGAPEVRAYDPLRWVARAVALRTQAASLLSRGGPDALRLRVRICRGGTTGACAGSVGPRSLGAPGAEAWAVRFGDGHLQIDEPFEADEDLDALAAKLRGVKGAAARAAGLPHAVLDARLRARARARLQAGHCGDALGLFQRSRDLRRPEAWSRRNTPDLFVGIARSALCAGRIAEALGAVRTLAGRFTEAQPAAELVQRVGVARAMMRGTTGDQKTNR